MASGVSSDLAGMDTIPGSQLVHGALPFEGDDVVNFVDVYGDVLVY